MDHFNAEITNGLGDMLIKHYEMKWQRELKAMDTKKNGFFYFITVNPDTTKITLDQFRCIVTKLLERKMFVNACYTFEQRGECIKDIGKGYHCHIICDKDSKLSPAQMQKNVYNTFKNYVGNIKHIDVRLYPTHCRKDKVDYLWGEKWDEGKEASVRLNKIWRGIHQLRNIYGIDINEKTSDSAPPPKDLSENEKASSEELDNSFEDA